MRHDGSALVGAWVVFVVAGAQRRCGGCRLSAVIHQIEILMSALSAVSLLPLPFPAPPYLTTVAAAVGADLPAQKVKGHQELGWLRLHAPCSQQGAGQGVTQQPPKQQQQCRQGPFSWWGRSHRHKTAGHAEPKPWARKALARQAATHRPARPKQRCWRRTAAAAP